MESYQIEKWLKNKDIEVQKNLYKTLNSMSQSFKNFLLIDEGNLTLTKLEHYTTQAGILMFNRPVKVIIIDYLGYLQAEGKDFYHKISALSKSQKELAKRLKCILISLHQITKAGKTGGDPVEGYMARDSGVVQESADIMISAWRPELRENITDAEKRDLEGVYKTKIIKNKYGVSGQEIDFFFIKKYLRLVEKREDPMEMIKSGQIHA